MKKNELLKLIAQTSYNVGFGAKKHFATYDLYRILPRFTSIIILIIGIVQISCLYKSSIFNNTNFNDILAITLIISSLLALFVDTVSANKEGINKKAKELTQFFHDLHKLYSEIKGLDSENVDDKYIQQLLEIENNAKKISDSNLAIFVNIYTHWCFFGGGMQIDWIDEQLHFKIKDKFPFLHYEAFILYAILILLLYKIILFFMNQFIN